MPLPFGSTVKLFANVPLDPMYEHTILFETVSAQRSYFDSLLVLSADRFTNLSYIRHTRGTIRLEADMSLLTNCNYLQFYNPSFNPAHTVGYEDVSFYCFVDSIEYVNEKTVEIKYTIDQMQTWMFYYDLNPCYVEREHASDDSIGANRINEGLDTGPYVCPGIETLGKWDSVYAGEDYDAIQNTTFVVVATQAPDGSQYSYQYNGIASSMYVAFAYDTQGLESILTSFRNGVTSSLEPIVSIGQFPSYFKPNATAVISPVTHTLAYDQLIGFGGFMAFDPRTTGVKTYLPNNNKLYQYPYNYMVFEAPDGSSIDLKFEDFKNNNVHQFVSTLSILPDIQTMCCPVNYEGDYGNATVGGKNVHYALYSKAYPYCAVASDAFSAWWAQNRYSMPVAGALRAGSDVVGKISNVANELIGIGQEANNLFGFAQNKITNKIQNKVYDIGSKYLNSDKAGTGEALIVGGQIGSALGLSAGGVMQSIGQDLAAIAGHQAVPDTLVTKANNGGVNHYMELDCYKIHYIKIRPEYAKIIDNYFSCFGYAVHEVKVPNITSRTEWNYIKTKGCTIKSNQNTSRFVPMEAERAICAIYDKGITFWHNPLHIHNYSLLNPIAT